MFMFYTIIHISSIDEVVKCRCEPFTTKEKAQKCYDDLTANILDSYQEKFDDDFDYEECGDPEGNRYCSFMSDEVNFDKIYKNEVKGMSTKKIYIIENGDIQAMFLEKPDSSDESYAVGDQIEMIVLDEIEQERIHPDKDEHDFIDHTECHREYVKERTLFDSMHKKGLLKQIF